MSLLRLQQVCFNLAGKIILDHTDLVVEESQRIAIMGRNGAGKTSLLKLIDGTLEADDGIISRQTDRIARMSQSPPGNLNQTVHDFILTGAKSADELSQHHIDRCLADCQLNANNMLTSLSGGQLRRASLAAALVNEPHILLLDEPTNHLDLESITWLEDFLTQSNLTILLISHDRAFIQKTCNRFIELDRGQLSSCQGTYQDFLQFRAQQLANEEKKNKLFDQRLSEEEKWIRQGIKARRTRNEGRVRVLKKMREEYQARRSQQGKITIENQKISASGKQILVINKAGYSVSNQVLFEDFSAIVHRGDKIGIIGANGCGKSTLIRCLLDDIKPTSGSIKQGARLDIVYFDQQRQQLDDNLSPIDIIGNGLTSVTINGKPKHIISYLQDFLFTPEQARQPIHKLSGGERNRLLMAKCFSKPSNVLVLDEPTNDLDIESLELLEEHLSQYNGTLLLISHDRSLLNNAVTCTWVFENNRIVIYAGGHDDYLSQSQKRKKHVVNASQPKPNDQQKSNQLLFEERKELSKLPKRIEKLEQKIDHKKEELANIHYEKPSSNDYIKVTLELKSLEKELELTFKRWDTLIKKEES